MDRIVNRIKINKLYSEPEIFEPVVFSDGVNIILGEKSNATTGNGRKTNGVGKSMSIEFINFCFLKQFNDSRIKLIPEDVLHEDVYIKLDIEIGMHKLTMMRNKKNESKPIIKKDEEKIYFEKLDDAQMFLKGLIYSNLNGEIVPSFRSLIAPLIREERSEFKNILECYNVSKKIPIDFKPHLFFLNILLEAYKNTQETVKRIEEVKSLANNAKKEVTDNNRKKIGDVKAELNSLEDEIKKMNDAIESLKSNEAFNSIEKDLLKLEDLLDKLRKRQKATRYEYNKIKSLPKPEEIENDEIEMLYNQFKSGLGDMIVKTLEETVKFKTKVEEFQRALINQRAIELQDELYNIAEDIRKLDDEYSAKLKIIDQKGVLKNLKSSLNIFNQKNTEYSKMKGLYDEYEKAEKEKKSLYLKKSQEILVLDNVIEENKSVLDSFLNTLLEIHEYIMGNKECSFTIDTVNKKTSKKTISIDMRIFDDGSHSVDRAKVFIYDMALMFNQYTRKRHPGFLIHDNIFDVDQDTLVQSLNFLAHQENRYQDFQYILTLNRDKIEHEERLQQIKLDIENHKVATFTKKSKFLGQNYQEK